MFFVPSLRISIKAVVASHTSTQSPKVSKDGKSEDNSINSFFLRTFGLRSCRLVFTVQECDATKVK